MIISMKAVKGDLSQKYSLVVYEVLINIVKSQPLYFSHQHRLRHFITAGITALVLCALALTHAHTHAPFFSG